MGGVAEVHAAPARTPSRRRRASWGGVAAFFVGVTEPEFLVKVVYQKLAQTAEQEGKSEHVVLQQLGDDAEKKKLHVMNWKELTFCVEKRLLKIKKHKSILLALDYRSMNKLSNFIY